MQGPPKIDLRIKCFDLKNMDLVSKSDPQVFVQQNFGPKDKQKYVGSTEKINNNLSPVFKKPITIEYYFETVQNLKFTVLDVDGEISDIDAPDYIGELQCTLGDIISSPGGKYMKQIRNKKGSLSGEIEITAEEIKVSNFQCTFLIQGNNFDKKDLFGKSDPYYIISRYSAQLGENVTCFKSEVHKNTLDPLFNQVTLKYEELNNCDVNAPLTFEFYDHDDVGKHDLIGILKTTTQEIINKHSQHLSFEIINPKKNKCAGVIKFLKFDVTKEATFLDYIYTGTELNLLIAIDCTYSNGPIDKKTSLHKLSTDGTLNQYESSILAVGNVLTSYDIDGLIPVYGFGGVLPGSATTNHCFAMTFNETAVNAKGITEVLNVYRNAMAQVELSGPTNFSQIIQRAIDLSPPIQYKYNILLIITDGEITDMEETKKKIVQASNHPISIIIVGVGSADFSSMDQLDSDGSMLKDCNGRACERDIVQFVPFSKTAAQGPEQLAKEVLKEVPKQLMSFMKNKKFVPVAKTI